MRNSKISGKNLAAFNTVANLRDIESRCNDGNRSRIAVSDAEWLRKESANPEWEYSCLYELQDTGLVPELNEDGLVGLVFEIKLIGKACSLAEYVSATVAGLIDVDVFVEVMGAVADTLEEFWSLGWVHGDLHCGNVVVSLTEQGTWRAYLVDLEYATSPSRGEPYGARTVCSQAEDDLDWLTQSLEECAILAGGTLDDIEEGLDVLEGLL